MGMKKWEIEVKAKQITRPFTPWRPGQKNGERFSSRKLLSSAIGGAGSIVLWPGGTQNGQRNVARFQRSMAIVVSSSLFDRRWLDWCGSLVNWRNLVTNNRCNDGMIEWSIDQWPMSNQLVAARSLILAKSQFGMGKTLLKLKFCHNITLPSANYTHTCEHITLFMTL